MERIFFLLHVLKPQVLTHSHKFALCLPYLWSAVRSTSLILCFSVSTYYRKGVQAHSKSCMGRTGSLPMPLCKKTTLCQKQLHLIISSLKWHMQTAIHPPVNSVFAGKTAQCCTSYQPFCAPWRAKEHRSTAIFSVSRHKIGLNSSSEKGTVITRKHPVNSELLKELQCKRDVRERWKRWEYHKEIWKQCSCMRWCS